MAAVMAQQTVADRMESARPREALRDRVTHADQRLIQRLLHDVVRTPAHFSCGTASEREHEDASRVDTVNREMRHTMRQRIRLARARAGDDQQRPRLESLRRHRLAIGDGLALRAVQFLEMQPI
jgi:hypothetical protein